MKAAVAGFGLALFLCACSSPAPAGQTTALRVIDVPGPGRVLGDAQGVAVYIYVPDNRGASTCYQACAAAWPPLVPPPGRHQVKAEAGVQSALVGTTRRADGELEVTYDGWPLYLYIGDSVGQVTGQALDMGTWYLISPAGTVDKTPVASQNS